MQFLKASLGVSLGCIRFSQLNPSIVLMRGEELSWEEDELNLRAASGTLLLPFRASPYVIRLYPRMLVLVVPSSIFLGGGWPFLL